MTSRARRCLRSGALVALLAAAAAGAEDDSAPGRARALERALAPHAWMGAQPDWPCRYSADFEQRRSIGERELVSHGQLVQDCEHGLVWQSHRPVVGAQVYAAGGNFLSFDRRGRSDRLDGLAQRRIGALLVDLFEGDVQSLSADFALGQASDRAAVRLVPRDARLSARLAGMEIRGDAAHTEIRVYAADTDAPLMSLVLSDFERLEAGEPGCIAALDAAAAGDGLRERTCDAVRRPARYLPAIGQGARSDAG